jgi:hypothetical protein
MTIAPTTLEPTLLELAQRYDRADDLFKAVRAAHPEASRKQIVLAALSAMIDTCDTDMVATSKLHKFAIENRGDS